MIQSPSSAAFAVSLAECIAAENSPVAKALTRAK